MRYTTILLLITIAGLSACKNNSQPQPNAETKMDSSLAVKQPAKDFSKLEFACKKDPSCGMPLTAGIMDTATYQGKLYGFCSAECKAEFEKDPAAYVAKLK